MVGIPTCNFLMSYWKQSLDVERFHDDNYPYYMIFEGIVDLALYDHTATNTKFIEVNTQDGIPDKLQWEDDDGGDYGPEEEDVIDVIDFIDDAVKDLERTVDNRNLFVRNGSGDQLLFANFPTFKSHVAIVMSVKHY